MESHLAHPYRNFDRSRRPWSPDKCALAAADCPEMLLELLVAINLSD